MDFPNNIIIVNNDIINSVMPRTPLFYMLVSVFLYSLFPLVGVFGTTGISGFTFAGLGHLLSAIVSIGCAAWLSRHFPHYRIATLIHDLRQHPVALRQAILSGIINYLSHACLFASFVYITKSSATMIFEAWPVLAVILIHMLSGHLQPNNRPASLDLRFYALSLMAFIGVIMMINPTSDSDTILAMPSSDTWIGLALATLSAAFMAYSVALGRNTRLYIEQQYGETTTQRAEWHRAFLASAATKTFGALGFLLTIPLMPSIAGDVASLGLTEWSWVAVNGIVIVTLGSLAYREALARTQRTEIALLWYTTPVFALAWLWLFGIEPITLQAGVGATIIIAANALLPYRFAVPGLLIGLCGVISLVAGSASLLAT